MLFKLSSIALSFFKSSSDGKSSDKNKVFRCVNFSRAKTSTVVSSGWCFFAASKSLLIFSLFSGTDRACSNLGMLFSSESPNSWFEVLRRIVGSSSEDSHLFKVTIKIIKTIPPITRVPRRDETTKTTGNFSFDKSVMKVLYLRVGEV